MGLTGLSQLPDSVRTTLRLGEEPLAWQPVDLAFGESRIGRPGPVKTITRIDLRPAAVIGGGPVEVDPGLFDRWLGGIALTGAAGSSADSLSRALTATTVRLCVTSQRVILFSEGPSTFGTDPVTGRKTWDAETTQLWAHPCSSVMSATRRSRPLMAGRLVLEFADGSSIALMCGALLPQGANRLRDAFNHARG